MHDGSFDVEAIQKALTEEKNFSRAVMEASPISYVLLNEDFKAVDCNNVALQVFGCPDKQYLLDHYWEQFSSVYQSDGRKSCEKSQAMKDRVFAEGKAVFEWEHRTLSGEPVPVENTLTLMVNNGEKFIISYKCDLRAIKKMEESIRWLKTEAEKIYYDGLTGIYNRRYFDETLGRLTKSLSRRGGILSLMMLDIDFFKKYNDTYGHSEGDKCLKIVAETLQKVISRADDFVARYGGEEFAVVLPSTDEKGACRVADKILEKIQSCKIAHKTSDIADHVTVSIGVITAKVDHWHSADDFIIKADELLYVSKQSGRNRYTFAAF